MMLMLGSCVYDDTALDSCTEENNEQLTLQMKLTLPTPIATRAPGHSTTEGTAAENYIDFEGGDYKILILDKNGKIVQEIESDDTECELTPDDRVGFSSYTLTAPLDLSDESAKTDMKKFRIMVLANWKAVGSSSFSAAYPSFDGYRANGMAENNVFKNKDSFTFGFPGGEEGNWTPSFSNPAAVRAIPMFGLSDEIDLAFALLMEKEGDMPVTSIPMLRSLAKIEIVDKTSSGLSNVRMDHLITPGRFIPDLEANPDWNVVGKQVSIPSLPSSVTVAATPGGLGVAFHSSGKDAGGFDTWTLYVPEVELKDGNPGGGFEEALGNRPFIGLQAGAISRAFPLDNIKPRSMEGLGTLRYVLRNHIYRFTVEEGGAELTVGLEVLPWDRLEVPAWNFENAVLSSPLSWKTVYTADDGVDEELVGTANGYNDKPAELRLLMKPGVTDYAEGTFRLDAPVGARWYAELISLNQDHHDSFRFVDASKNPFLDSEGNILNYATGIIDGTSFQTIRIMNIAEKVYEENNEARLVITIEYPDKTRKEVFVVAPGSAGNNYTIVQEITEFM